MLAFRIAAPDIELLPSQFDLALIFPKKALSLIFIIIIHTDIGVTMSSSTKSQRSTKAFEPLEVMGYFWFVLGVVVLVGSFFIKETEHVPQIRGVVTNVVAGSILFVIGLFSILRGRANKRKGKEV